MYIRCFRNAIIFNPLIPYNRFYYPPFTDEKSEAKFK